MDDAHHTADAQWSRPSFAVIGADAFLAARPATAVQVAQACARAGYDAAIPATWGDELIAARCAKRLADRSLGPAIFCSCALVRDRLMAPGPDLLPFVMSFVSPPVATARYLRELYAGRPIDITYVGGCPSADDEAIDRVVAPAAFFAELRAQGISVTRQPTVFESTFAPDRRRHVSQPGGMPAPTVLDGQPLPRRVVEIGAFEYAADLAQLLILNEPVLADLGVRSGCLCAGASAAGSPAEARRAVVALEPPRSAQPIVEPTVHVMVDLPLTPPPDADRRRPWNGPPPDRHEDVGRDDRGHDDRGHDDRGREERGPEPVVREHDGDGATPVGGADSLSWFASAIAPPFDATFDVQFDAAFRAAFVARPAPAAPATAAAPPAWLGDREVPLATHHDDAPADVADLAAALALDERVYDVARDTDVVEETQRERRVALRRAADVDAYRADRLLIDAAAMPPVETSVDAVRGDAAMADIAAVDVAVRGDAAVAEAAAPEPRAVQHPVAGLVDGMSFLAVPARAEISHGHLTELRFEGPGESWMSGATTAPRANAPPTPRRTMHREQLVRIPSSVEPAAPRRPVQRTTRGARRSPAARLTAAVVDWLRQCGAWFVRVPASVYIMSFAAAVAVAVFVSASVHTRRSLLAHVESGASTSLTSDIGR